MAKMKVHELAKELEIESKSIIEFLKGTEHEVKAAQSSLEEAAQDMVRNKFAKKAVTAPKKEDAEGKERPKKKASIAAVFNPQYSKQPQRRPAGPNGQQKKAGAKSEGERRPEGRGPKREGAPKQEQHTIIKPRPVGERAMRPISERTKQNEELVMASTASEQPQVQKEVAPVERPQQVESKPEKQERPARNDRPQGDRPNKGDRPQGDRPNRGDRSQGDRPNRGDRPQGDRPPMVNAIPAIGSLLPAPRRSLQ